MTIIDVHTHMLSDGWAAMLRAHGAPSFAIRTNPSGSETLMEDGVPSFTFCREMFDYALRLKDMDAAGIDVSIVSLTGPSVYWGGEAVSAEAAQVINDNMREAQTAHPDRIRFLATLPWQYPERAVAELDRACAAGAVGVMVLANIRGMHLTDPHFAPVWQAIDARSLPVLVHPTTPPGMAEMALGRLLPTVGFTFDTSLAVGRMVLDGFLDRYPNLAIIACHAGGTLPWLAQRMDLFFEARTPPEERKIAGLPSEHLRRLYYDSITFERLGLEMTLEVGGPDHLMFGTDYPHPSDIPRLKAAVEALAEPVRNKVFSANAERLFGL